MTCEVVETKIEAWSGVSGREIAQAARNYLGAKWKHQSRGQHAMDCAGLVIRVSKDLGLSDFDKTDYPRQATDESMLAICRSLLIEINRTDLRPGDVVVLRFGANRHICIVGDYLYGGLSMIHAQTMWPRQVVENQLTDVWLHTVKASIAACFRFPGVRA